jgi:hypothetical protein
MRKQILLGVPDTFFEWRRCWLIEDLYTPAGTFSDVHLIQTWIFIGATGRNDPCLARR